MFHLSPARPHHQPRGFWTFWAALLAACALLVACGGGGGGSETSSTPDPSGAVTQIIGAEGGTVTGPDGVQVVIPAGALDANTTIGIARSSAGAPPTLEGYPPLGPVYAFTPHGIHFNTPITIRLPMGSADHKLFMASADDDWNDTAFTYSDGMAEFARRGFSWAYPSTACGTSPNDPSHDPIRFPSRCVSPNINPTASATPAAALVSAGGIYRDSNYTLNQAALLRFTLGLYVPADCTNASFILTRSDHLYGQWGNPVTVAQQSVGLVTGGSPPTRSATGSASIDLAMTALDNGRQIFGLRGECTRNGRTVRMNREIFITTQIAAGPPPPTSLAIGGTLSGLSGSGLVLQNNASDNLALAANGSFRFATLLATGHPYSVTVLTQPSGQICSVQNGSGSAQAGVTPVAVVCTDTVSGTKNWQGVLPVVTNSFTASGPRVAIDASGHGMAVWMQQQTSGGDTRLWAVRYNPLSGWGIAFQIDSGSGTTQMPQIAMDGSGNALVVWSQIDTSTVNGQSANVYRIFSNYYSTGIGWGTATEVESTRNGSTNSPRVAFDASGHATALWTSTNGRIWSKGFTASTGWGNATAIADTFNSANLAVSANGDAYAVWLSNDGIPWSRYYRASSGWGTATPISIGTSQGIPKIAADAHGNAMAVWTQATDNSGNNISTLYANHSHGGNWGTAEHIDSSYDAHLVIPQIAMQANGDAKVVWFSDLNNVLALWTRAYAAGIWGTAQLLEPETSDIGIGEPQLSLDSQGNALLLLATGPYQNIRAQRYGVATGWETATWLTDLTTPSFPGRGQAQLAMNPQGNAMAAWTADTGNGLEIFLDLYRAPAP